MEEGAGDQDSPDRTTVEARTGGEDAQVGEAEGDFETCYAGRC